MMTQDARAKLKTLLIKYEDKRNFPYVDTTGNITIGVGYNLSQRGISDTWIYQQLQDDMDFFIKKLQEEFQWFNNLDEVRQIVLVNMCFNLGFKNFLGFKRMLTAIENKDYKKASKAMLSSEWANQVGDRAKELAKMMENGEIQL